MSQMGVRRGGARGELSRDVIVDAQTHRALSEVVPSARHGRVAAAEPVLSKSPPWTMSAAPR